MSSRLSLFVSSVAIAALLAGWVARSLADAPAATVAWRLAFFAVLTVVLLNVRLIRALWRGRLHLAKSAVRAVPFADQEMVPGSLLDPRAAGYGVTGRAALIGLGLVFAGFFLWLGGLAFGSQHASGLMTLGPGATSSAIQPHGVPYALAVPNQQHALIGRRPEADSVDLRVQDPRTRRQATYSLSPGHSVLLEDYRISLASAPAELPVRVRFTRRWVWWWRILVVLTIGLGAVLVRSVRHRTWVWRGRSGDYQLSCWSINGPSTLAAWTEASLLQALGGPAYDELLEVERALSRSDA